MTVTRDHIIAEIHRTADENSGKPLGQGSFASATGIGESDWRGVYWTKWSEALVEAGYPPNKMNEGYPEEFLVGKLASLIQKLGRFPTKAHLMLERRTDKSLPSHNVFFRLGSKTELARKVLAYCERRHDLGSVAAICRVCATAGDDEPATNVDEEECELGFVYLMKSGSHYKIGRSNCAERREFELRLQLPEKVKLIHKIKTDDPVGIEEYWHRRFKDKRKGGEWFALCGSDVKAFRRRKFM